MKKPVLTYSALIYFTCVGIIAQNRDTVRLDEVTVTDVRSRISSKNFNELKADSVAMAASLFGNVAQMLMQQNASFVKAYGPGNIAALSIRGSTAQQTAIVWNGININNPMLGQADVSLLPLGFFDNVSLQKGPLSSYWGSGAMAGVLNLQSATPKEGINIKESWAYSSLQNVTHFVSAGFEKEGFSSNTRIVKDISDNKYNYYNHPDSLTIKTQEHAGVRQFAIMQDFSFKLNENEKVGLHLWYQDADRQIPGTLQEVAPDAAQRDSIIRYMIDWSLAKGRYSVTTRSAFCYEWLFYNNNTSGTHAVNFFKTFVQDVEGQVYLNKYFTLTAGNTNTLSNGSSGDVYKKKEIFRTAFYENILWNRRRISASVYGRQEVFNNEIFVPTAGFNAAIKIFHFLSAKVNAGSIYRYPTLNDLYWNPGGNPSLKPEHGLSGEGSLELKYNIRNFYFASTGTLFTRRVKDWIMWQPGKNGMWSPQNVLEVWSRGGETNTEIIYAVKSVKASLQVLTNYVLSTRTQTLLENDESAGRQLPYVPMYSGSATFYLQYKNTSLRSVYVYTSYRYLTADNYNYLAPYSVLDLRLSHNFIFKTILLNVFAEGNNLLNQNYFSVAQYPMPLRNFRVGLVFQYNKHNKNK